MAHPERVEPVMVLVSVIHRSDEALKRAAAGLEETFGSPRLRSEPYRFDMSPYYEEEMGTALQRVWLVFGRLDDPARLPGWKLSCYRLEGRLSTDGRRTVNLDPGYMDLGKLVLASFKPAPEKVYMGDGVWAHTCLLYGHGRFTAPEHSFPDFADGRFDEFLTEVRRAYRRLLAEEKG